VPSSRQKKGPARPNSAPRGLPQFRTAVLRDTALGILLFCTTFVAYGPALRGGLILDDVGHLTRPDMQSLHGLWRIWFELGSVPQYYPLVHSVFWLQQKLWGFETLGYHLTNVALHAIAALFVVAIVRRLSLPGGWLAGFLFALHPVHVETAAWISEQKNTFSAVFYLAAALVYLNFDRTRRKSRYFLAFGLFVLALLSKSVTATLPAALLVIFWWRRGRLNWKRDILPLLPWLATGAAAGLFTAWVERRFIGAEGPEFSLTLLQRSLLAGRVFWFYLAKLVWPADLSFFYRHWTVDPGVWWQYLFTLGALALGIGLWLVARRQRGPMAALLFFGGTLFPVMGFFNIYPFICSYVYDHFQYLASLGVIVPVACGLSRLPLPRWASPALSGLLLVTFGTLTWRQSATYRDADTLYTATLARNPQAWLAHHNLASIILDTPDRLPEAVEHLQAGLQIKPDNAQSHTNLGRAFTKMGRLPEAVAELRTALRLEPGSPLAHDSLGNALSNMGRMPEAIAEHQAALKSKPDDAQAHNNLGRDLAKMSRLPEAIAEFDAALHYQPEYAEAHSNRGLAMAKMGRLTDSIPEFQAALRIDPNSAAAHGNLGSVLLNMGRLPEALTEFETAARIEPQNPQTHYNLAFALSKVPDRLSDAIPEYQQAVQLDPNFAQAQLNLGDALSGTGRLPEALTAYEAAARVVPDPRLRGMVESLRAALRSARK
jgi:tetratricopeptide (TPR) repeat protein